MSRSLLDLVTYCKAIVEAQPWLLDPRCLPIPWREVQKQSKLKFGVMWHDGIVYPTPPVARALKHTVQKLREAGHEIIDWEPIDHEEAVKILVSPGLNIDRFIA
jgi:amidase